MSYAAGRQAYSSISTGTSVEAASPHKLIMLLLDGALEKIAVAKGQIQRNEVSEKANSISRAIAIIEGLQLSLDRSVNHELTTNLDELYSYMCHQLLQANLKSDARLLEEVATLLKEIREAWQAIEVQASNQQVNQNAPVER